MISGASVGFGFWLHDLLTTKKDIPPGSVILTPLPQVNPKESIEKSSNATTEDQWKFLHKFSKKVFSFLKYKQKGGADQKDNVIQWLKDKFSGSIENTEDKWENFKSLCETQLKKEPKGNNEDNQYLVNIEESRLCFMGTELSPIKNQSPSIFDVSDDSYYGNISKWDLEDDWDEEENRPYPNLGFNKYRNINLNWWQNFKNKYSENQVEEKFDEWWESLNWLTSK